MPTTICIDCHRLTPRSPCKQCRGRRNQQRDQRRGTAHQRGYTSRWQKLSAQVIAEEPTCHWCQHAPSTSTDHIVSKARGGTDDRDNLCGSCTPCNSAKRDRPTP